jgi:hypothetical protein
VLLDPLEDSVMSFLSLHSEPILENPSSENKGMSTNQPDATAEVLEEALKTRSHVSTTQPHPNLDHGQVKMAMDLESFIIWSWGSISEWCHCFSMRFNERDNQQRTSRVYSQNESSSKASSTSNKHGILSHASFDELQPKFKPLSMQVLCGQGVQNGYPKLLLATVEKIYQGVAPNVVDFGKPFCGGLTATETPSFQSHWPRAHTASLHYGVDDSSFLACKVPIPRTTGVWKFLK